MNEDLSENEKDDTAFWRFVYSAVVGFTFLVIVSLWAFSLYFS